VWVQTVEVSRFTMSAQQAASFWGVGNARRSIPRDGQSQIVFAHSSSYVVLASRLAAGASSGTRNSPSCEGVVGVVKAVEARSNSLWLRQYFGPDGNPITCLVQGGSLHFTLLTHILC